MSVAIALLAATVVGTAAADARREGYYSTIVVFAMGAVVYYAAIPVELWVTGGQSVSAGRVAVALATDVQVKVVLMTSLAILGFWAGHRIANGRPAGARRVERPVAQPPATPPPPYGIVAAGLVSLVPIALLYTAQVKAVQSYYGHVAVAYENGVFSFLVTVVVLSTAVWAAWQILAWRRGLLPVMLVILLCGWGVYASDKDPILMAGLAAGAALARRRRARAAWLVLFAVGGVATLWIGSVALSQFRAGAEIDLGAPLRHGWVFRATDASGPIVSIGEYMGRDSGLSFGVTYVRDAVLWIPRLLWPSRPLDLAEEFARSHMPQWRPGFGLGFSLLAEAYANFGVAGAFIQYLMLGGVWGLGWRLVRRVLGHDRETVWRALYVVFGYYVLLVMHRGPVGGMVTLIAQGLAPLVLACRLVDRGIRRYQGRHGAMEERVGARRRGLA